MKVSFPCFKERTAIDPSISRVVISSGRYSSFTALTSDQTPENRSAEISRFFKNAYHEALKIATEGNARAMQFTVKAFATENDSPALICNIVVAAIPRSQLVANAALNRN